MQQVNSSQLICKSKYLQMLRDSGVAREVQFALGDVHGGLCDTTAGQNF